MLSTTVLANRVLSVSYSVGTVAIRCDVKFPGDFAGFLVCSSGFCPGKTVVLCGLIISCGVLASNAQGSLALTNVVKGPNCVNRCTSKDRFKQVLWSGYDDREY
jgi:hypothetical protein